MKPACRADVRVWGDERMKRKGFTLIELLVVIAIIMVLAAILFPVFSTAKRRAEYTTCSHNTEQWLKAMMMYMNDWQDRFPVCGANLRFAHPGKPPFYQVVKKYVSGGEAAKWCPAMVRAYCNGNYATAEKVYGWSYWFQCVYSWGGFGSVNDKANLCGIPLSDVKWPSRSPAIGDTNRCHECKDCGENSGQRAYIYPIGYCDGHVRNVVMVCGDESKYWYVGVDGSLPRR